MWRVADEPYDQVLVEYALLAETERLDEARAMDGRYHLAKLIAAGFNDPDRIWTEHEDYRATLLRHPETTPDLMAVGARMWQRALQKGIIPPPSGAN